MTSSQTLIFREEQNAFDATASESDIFNCFRLILVGIRVGAERATHVIRVGELLSHVVPIYVDSTEYKILRASREDARSVELDGYSFSLLQGILRLAPIQ